jgi:LPS-assembly lipoprotein
VISRRTVAAAVAGLVLALVLGLPAGCGFHLRGHLDIPPGLSPLYIQAAGGSAVMAALTEQLRGGGVALAPSADAAKLVLRLLSETRASRVVATDSAGKVLAYEQHFRVAYDAVTPDGKTRVPREDLDLSRTFDNPDVEMLGKQLEGEQIFQEMAADAADRILLRLRAALR